MELLQSVISYLSGSQEHQIQHSATCNCRDTLHQIAQIATGLRPAERNLDEDEIIQEHEVECEEALNMIRRGEIQDAKSIAGLFLAFEWLKENE